MAQEAKLALQVASAAQRAVEARLRALEELDELGEQQLKSLTAYTAKIQDLVARQKVQSTADRYRGGLDSMNRRKNRIIEGATLPDDTQVEDEHDLGPA